MIASEVCSLGNGMHDRRSGAQRSLPHCVGFFSCARKRLTFDVPAGLSDPNVIPRRDELDADPAMVAAIAAVRPMRPAAVLVPPLRSLQVLLLPRPSVPGLHPPFGSDLLRFDFPRRVVRDVHSGVAAFTGERGHRITCERLSARDTRILPSTSGNEMSTATHIRLRFVDIARIER